jgi:hypothetical protein
MSLSLSIRASGIAAGAEGGVRAGLRFTDLTGNEVAIRLVEKSDRDFSAGSCDWTEVALHADVPNESVWMQAVLGLGNATGKVDFREMRMNLVRPIAPILEPERRIQ